MANSPTVTVQRDVISYVLRTSDGGWTINLECGHSTVLSTMSMITLGAQLYCPECTTLATNALPA